MELQTNTEITQQNGSIEDWKKRFEHEQQVRKSIENELANKNLEVSKAHEIVLQKLQELTDANLKLGLINKELTIQDVELRQATEKLKQANDELTVSQQEFAKINKLLIDSEVELDKKVQQRTNQLLSALEEAQKAKEDAQKAAKIKSEFLANMSHELRTPLNGILGYAQILMDNPELQPTFREKIAIINTSGEHLLGLINNVLDLSKIEAGQMEIHLTQVDLERLIRELKNLFKNSAQRKNLILQFELHKDVTPFVLADHAKIRQSLINLIGNSIKFTDKGFVELHITPAKNDKVKFEIKDTGKGIPPQKIQDILQPYKQVSADDTGTGLGLTITKSFIELMGGIFEIHSEVNKGSTFSFDLELKEYNSSAFPIPSNLPNQRKIIGIANEGPFKILVVDDNIINRDLAQTILERIGFQVQVAVDGQEAIQHFLIFKPQLILMDIRMPVMGGQEAANVLRQLPDGKNVKIIALTASAFFQNKDEFLQKGCDDFLAKPFRANELLEVIANYVPVEYTYEEINQNETKNEADIHSDFNNLIKILPKTFTKKYIEYLDIGNHEAIKTELQKLANQDPQFKKLAQHITLLIDDINHESLDTLAAQIKQNNVL